VKTCRQLNLAVPAGVSTDTNDVHIDAVTIYALENVPCDSSLQLLCGNYSPTHDYYSRVAPRKVDIILFNIRQYFKDVTTRRQLALDVLAGFHQENDLQRQFQDVVTTTKFVPPLSEYTIFQDKPYDVFVNDEIYQEPTLLPQ